MKNFVLGTIALSSAALMSCGGGNHTEEATADHQEAHSEVTQAAENFTVDASSSTLKWTGEVARVYGHYGVISLKSGELTVEGDKITGGEFVVDMNTIVPQDSGYSEENPASKLVGHLATDDFFSIANHPTASFVVTGATAEAITGNLTVRGKTNEEKILLNSFEKTDEGVTASGKLVFDRQKYDVAWVHYMKDMILSDDITLDITLVAKK